MKKIFFISIALFLINASVFCQIFDLYSFPYRRTVNNVNFVLSTQWGSIHELDSFNIETSGENNDSLIINCYYTDLAWAQPIHSIDTLDFSDKLIQNSYYIKFRVILVPPYGIEPIYMDSCYYSMVAVYNDTKIDVVNKKSNIIFLYPNPTNDFIIISYELNKIQDIDLRIYNEIGKIVYNKKLGKIKNGNLNIDISGYNKGIYFAKFYNKNNNIETRKLIVE